MVWQTNNVTANMIDLPGGAALETATVIAVAILVVFLCTRVVRWVVRRVIRLVAYRSVLRVGRNERRTGGWQVRLVRIGEDGSVSLEQRRRQRIDAASRMISHLISVGIWLVTGIAIFHLLDINPTLYLSSAGFLGAGMAIGGQHKVNDYLTGLNVHFEDRYGVGDRIRAEIGFEEPVEGVVAGIGLFTTRVRDHRSTVHIANHLLVGVQNLSQEAALTTLRVRVGDDVDPGDAADVLGGLAGGTGLTGVVVVGEPSARQVADGEVEVDLRTTEPLNTSERGRLIGEAERRMSGPSGQHPAGD